jgi:hypothetical protein
MKQLWNEWPVEYFRPRAPIPTEEAARREGVRELEISFFLTPKTYVILNLNPGSRQCETIFTKAIVFLSVGLLA